MFSDGIELPLLPLRVPASSQVSDTLALEDMINLAVQFILVSSRRIAICSSHHFLNAPLKKIRRFMVSPSSLHQSFSKQ